MPIYTYRCENCGVQFERQQRFDDQPLTRCPECCKKTLRKVYTPVGIVFKGSGFYATDHRSPSGSSRGSKSEDTEGKNTPGENKPKENESKGTPPKDSAPASKEE
jgi:putative FmdB family regulatory protein